MYRFTTHRATHGTFTLGFEAFGGLKHELGAEEFAAWLDHAVSVTTAAVGMAFADELRDLVKKTGPEQGRSNYYETMEIRNDGTTVKVTLELRLKVALTGEQRVTLAGKFLRLIRLEFAHHLDDKASSTETKLTDALAGLILGDLEGFLGGNPLTARRNGMFSDMVGGYQVDGLGSASAFPYRG